MFLQNKVVKTFAELSGMLRYGLIFHKTVECNLIDLLKIDWKKYLRNTAIYCKAVILQNSSGNGHGKKTIQTQF